MQTAHLSDLERLLKLQIHLHGNDSTEVSKVLRELAKFHLDKGEYTNAESMYKRALTIEENTSERDPKAIEEILSRLSEIAKGRESVHDETDRLKVSSDHIPVFTLPKEALLPSNNGSDHDEADRDITEAKRHIDQLKVSGEAASVTVADSLTKLADLYGKRRMYAEMEPVLVEALKIRESVCGTTHMSVSTDLKNLARLYIVLRQYERAEPMLQRAISIREAVLGLYHPNVADLAEIYARLLRKIGQADKAAEMDKLVTASRERHGTDWEKFKGAGEKALADGDYVGAQAMWFAALDEAREFRFDDPRLSTTLESLAQVYWKRGKFDKAAPLCRQLLQVSESILGREHADVATAANNLALVYDRLGKYSEAAMLYQQALMIKERIFGDTSPDVVTIREAHAKARQMAQRQVELKADQAAGRTNMSLWWKTIQPQE